MESPVSRVNIYNEEYIALNHAYVQMYKFYNRLLEANDADDEVLNVMREILLVFNPTLDRIKSEMTIKTRFKEEAKENSKKGFEFASPETVSEVQNQSDVILHGNFTGD